MTPSEIKAAHQLDLAIGQAVVNFILHENDPHSCDRTFRAVQSLAGNLTALAMRLCDEDKATALEMISLAINAAIEASELP